MLKRLLAYLLAILLLVPISFLPGCARVGSAMSGTGNIIDQEVDVADFTRIDIHGEFSVTITQAEKFSVTVSTDDNLISRIIVSREDEILKLNIEAPGNFFPTSLKTTITLPRLYSLSLSREASASLSGFQTTFNFDLNLAEGSSLTGYLETGITRFDISGASQATLAGKAIELILEASGKSKMDLGDYLVNDAHANLRESSEATMNVSQEFYVVLSDASKMYYLGDPQIKNSSISNDSIMQHK
jgi:hypothetical protein